MKKNFLFFAGLVCALLLTCCSEIDESLRGPEGGKGNLSFTLNIPGSAANTYATIDAVGGEDEVHTLYVLFFEASNDGSGKFLEAHDISPASGSVYKSGQTIHLELEAESNISKSESYNLLFLANADYYLEIHGGISKDWAAEFEGKTENEIKQKRVGITANPASPGSNYYSYSSYIQDNLMMSGAVTKAANEENVLTELTRIVSRFDVVNKAGAEYKLVSASIWNAFPVQTVWDINFSDFTLDRIQRLYGIIAEGDTINGGLYAYENFVTQPTQNDALTTCLILGIEYKGQVSYYRVNACLDNQSQQLKRNNAYTFTIVKVLGLGDNSEEDAYRNEDAYLNVQINEWDVDNQGNIIFDGENILAITSTNVTFDRTGGEVPVEIYTAGEGELQLTQQDLPAGFSVNLDKNVLTVTATPSDVDKAGYAVLQFGKLKTTVRINQTGDIGEYLTLSHTSLPTYPSSPSTGEVVVTATSSGPWSAYIYNADGRFTFDNGGTTMTGDNMTTFSINTIAQNSDILTEYAFVLVTLDSDPDLSRVLIISQKGTGDIVLQEAHREVRFSANGDYMTAPEDYTFHVSTQDNQPWDVALYGPHRDYFEYSINSDSTEVSITAKGVNPDELDMTAQLRIFLKANTGVNTNIDITQEHHSLTVIPETFAIIPTDGGNSEGITATGTTTWTATLEAYGNEAYFNNTPGLTVFHSTKLTDVFNVTFAPLLDAGVTPQAIVTVTLDGTDIERQVIVTQQSVALKKIVLQNSNTWYGYFMAPTGSYYRINYVEQLYQSMTNPEWFGSNGTFVSGGVEFMEEVNLVPSAGVDIFVMNCFDGNINQGNQIRSWLDGNPNRLVLGLSDDRSNNFVNYLLMTGYTAIGGTGNNVVKTDFPRTLNTGDQYTADTNKLYEYLLRTGPFTAGGPELSKSDIKLLPYDASNGALTAWPSTMIPLMLDENNKSRLLLGVDPTLRIIYTGEMDLFGSAGVESIAYTDATGTYTG
ncbi:MAG: hypothetical protein LUG51_04155, partial [Tannerellaceae bacterium]|nr:hypothetical protein [Tannerellaceae bacterium]